jgi:hypothetical protein
MQVVFQCSEQASPHARWQRNDRRLVGNRRPCPKSFRTRSFAGHSYCYFALNIIGNRYLSMPPIIQMMISRLEMTAPPSISADKSVAPRLSNSCCPASLRRLLRRFLTHSCSAITTGIRARDTSRLYSELSINNQPSVNNRYRNSTHRCSHLFLLIHPLYYAASGGNRERG